MRFDDNFDVILGYHGAPVLAGIKPGNLISFNKDKVKHLKKILPEYKACLKCKGIGFFVLAETSRWLLLLVYRRRALAQILKQEKIREFLQHYDYDECSTVCQYLRRLKSHMLLQKGFPHEIGIFLGYPLADVRGFIENGGKNFKLAGAWKVYDNPQQAEMIFADYAECSRRFCCSVIAGEKLKDLAKAI